MAGTGDLELKMPSDDYPTRRKEAARWLRKTVGVVVAKDLPAEPSEEDFLQGLRSGMILCNLVNKLQPGAIPKVVEAPSAVIAVPDEEALSAYYENIRNFLVAVEDLGLPTFDFDDLEEGGDFSKVVDCLLALKSFSDWKKLGGSGSRKMSGHSKSSPSAKSFNRKNSEPLMTPLSRTQSVGSDKSLDTVDQSGNASDAKEESDSGPLFMIICDLLEDKEEEDIPIIVENILKKLTEEFESRLVKRIQRVSLVTSHGLSTIETPRTPSEAIKPSNEVNDETKKEEHGSVEDDKALKQQQERMNREKELLAQQEKARKQQEEEERAKREEQERIKREKELLEEQERLRKQEEERIRREEEERIRREEEERIRREEEEEERIRREEEERIRREEERIRREEEERIRREEEERIRREEEERIRREEEERIRREEEERIRREEEERIKREEEERIKREEEERIKKEKELREEQERLRKQKEEAKLAKEERARLAREEKARLAREEKERIKREKELLKEQEKARKEAERIAKEQERKKRENELLEEQERVRKQHEEEERAAQEQERVMRELELLAAQESSKREEIKAAKEQERKNLEKEIQALKEKAIKMEEDRKAAEEEERIIKEKELQAEEERAKKREEYRKRMYSYNKLHEKTAKSGVLVQQQHTELQELRNTLSTAKTGVQSMQKDYLEEADNLGKHVRSVCQAAAGYKKVLDENRKLYNQVQDLKGNIRVYCRVRPFLPGQENCVTSVDYIDDDTVTVIVPSKSGREGRKASMFTKVFGPSATQEDVFADTQPLIRSVLDGFNVCIFAYGQTGSGKTYTLTGPSDLTPETVGVNYRALKDLFLISEERKDDMAYEISVNMLEIYNDEVRDLLVTDGIEIQNGAQKGINVPGANLVRVTSTDEVVNLMNLSKKNRAVSSTDTHDGGSRSHRGCMHLVDLAGSEKTDDSEEEARHISKSLSAFGDVMVALALKSSKVNYKGCKLTQLLQDALGGQAKILVFVHVHPDLDEALETVNTLKFIERFSTVEGGAGKSGEVRELKEQIALLKAALTKKEGGEGQSQGLRNSPSLQDLSTNSPRSGDKQNDDLEEDSIDESEDTAGTNNASKSKNSSAKQPAQSPAAKKPAAGAAASAKVAKPQAAADSKKKKGNCWKAEDIGSADFAFVRYCINVVIVEIQKEWNHRRLVLKYVVCVGATKQEEDENPSKEQDRINRENYKHYKRSLEREDEKAAREQECELRSTLFTAKTGMQSMQKDYQEEADNLEEVFTDARSLMHSILDGSNVCIFAYDQTGDWKTYTPARPNGLPPEMMGVKYRVLNHVFLISEERSMHVLDLARSERLDAEFYGEQTTCHSRK
ncbi:hypothetical protein L6452_01640 [Arctium lappa]|uniref:Uncharacterized protein n=1 Tax=Arctium lappa TaxID=4217 RepID=A0ACB9FH94_ARCLA|nr:hypothetical protein L6452_01640 [Arctium lappa]